MAALLVVAAITGFAVIRDYRSRPGILESESLRAVERGTDRLVLEWDAVRNTDTYVVLYKPAHASHAEWKKAELDAGRAEAAADKASPAGQVQDGGDTAESPDNSGRARVRIKNLEEGTTYVVIIRPDNDERTGISTGGRRFTTLMSQKISVRKKFDKLSCSKPFNLDARASTPLSYESSDESVLTVDKDSGEVTLKGAGTAKIKITARETKKYAAAGRTVKVRVIGAESTAAAGASMRAIYHVDETNCKVVKSITGSGSVTVPQALGYSGDKYYVAYGMSDSQRIITFDAEGDGKEVSVPDIALGHPNGFTYADSTGKCYCVKGWGGRCVTYDPSTGEYGVFNLPNGASGISYDRALNRFYTCTRTRMVAYSGDGDWNVLNTVGVVKHGGTMYTQDCGGHAGIMFRCLSGPSKHGTNYIDLYDMVNGRYLGTIICELSEVESCIVDKDGYLEILSNDSGSTDYIWKTDLNIDDIGAGL